MSNFFSKKNKGFSLIETMFAVAIFSLIIAMIGAFQADIISFNSIIQTGLRNQGEAKNIIRPFSNEVRGALPSSQGAYALATVDETTFTFFTDIDDDSLVERIRYFLDGTDFKKGIIKPDPVTYEYDENTEEIIEVIHDVVNGTIFYYYDSSYDGSASSTPLSHPVTPSDVRMIKIVMIIDDDPNKAPAPITVSTQVSIRNLKDNL